MYFCINLQQVNLNKLHAKNNFFNFYYISFIWRNCTEIKKQRQEEKRAHINNLIKEEEEGVIAYKKSFVFGAKLISDGYGVFFELGQGKFSKKIYFYINLKSASAKT